MYGIEQIGVMAALVIMGVIAVLASVQRALGNAGVNVGGQAAGGKASKGVAFRSYEGDVSSVDTLTTVNAFCGQTQTMIVPQGAIGIKSLSIDMSLDLGAGVVSVRGHGQVRLTGQGVVGSPHDFGGPALTVQGVTSGLLCAQGHTRYDNVGIPVVAGADIQVQCGLIGEDPGDATFAVTIEYILG